MAHILVKIVWHRVCESTLDKLLCACLLCQVLHASHSTSQYRSEANVGSQQKICFIRLRVARKIAIKTKTIINTKNIKRKFTKKSWQSILVGDLNYFGEKSDWIRLDFEQFSTILRRDYCEFTFPRLLHHLAPTPPPSSCLTPASRGKSTSPSTGPTRHTWFP